MAESFTLRVLTPTDEIFAGVVSHATASGFKGEFGVLPGHYAYITAVRPGPLTFIVDGDAVLRLRAGGRAKETPLSRGATCVLAVGDGFAQVTADQVSILVASAEDPASLDGAATLAVLQKAEAKLLEAGPGDPGYAAALTDQAIAQGRLLSIDRAPNA